MKHEQYLVDRRRNRSCCSRTRRSDRRRAILQARRKQGSATTRFWPTLRRPHKERKRRARCLRIVREGQHSNVRAAQSHFPDEIPRSQDSPRAGTSRPLHSRRCRNRGELPVKEDGSNVLASVGVGVRECQRGAAVDADRPHLVEQRVARLRCGFPDCEQTLAVRCPGRRDRHRRLRALVLSTRKPEPSRPDDGELCVCATRVVNASRLLSGDQTTCDASSARATLDARMAVLFAPIHTRPCLSRKAISLPSGETVGLFAACERHLALLRHVRRRIHVAAPSRRPCLRSYRARRTRGVDDCELFSSGRAGQEWRHLLASGGDTDQSRAVRVNRVDIPAAVTVACEHDPVRAGGAVPVATAAEERQREGCDAYWTADSSHGWDRYRHGRRAARGL